MIRAKGRATGRGSPEPPLLKIDFFCGGLGLPQPAYPAILLFFSLCECNRPVFIATPSLLSIKTSIFMIKSQ